MDWIKTKDSLPPIGQRVLTTRVKANGEIVVAVLFRNGRIKTTGETWWCGNGRISNWQVLAWMPLPEPYEYDFVAEGRRIAELLDEELKERRNNNVATPGKK